ADNDPTAIAHAVSAVVARPEQLRRSSARRRAETFTWQRAAAGMLTTLGADDGTDAYGRSQNTA
ncbi:MAG: alpha-(1-2)-phosphatidylinositol mannosyltransferase, partial [Mycobacterium sp.]